MVKACSAAVLYSECENRAGVFRASPSVICELQSVLGQNMEKVYSLGSKHTVPVRVYCGFCGQTVPRVLGVFMGLSPGTQWTQTMSSPPCTCGVETTGTCGCTQLKLQLAR